ncbi:hypothetical protein KM043_005302 [Ampulex compressa]|nr:hypothetical protein KM043_005302 [Ampulex compressa]
MTSKVSRDTLYECVNGVLQHSQDKKRKFLETVELQIGLKNYDPQKDKRFSGTVKLKNIPRPKMQVCILGDQQHCDEAKANNIPYMDAEALKKLNKNKKLVKKLAKKYDAFLASESLIKQIPRIVGPGLNKAGKFPGLLSHQESMVGKMDEVKATIKFQMKKVLCLSVAVGHVEMTPDELVQNVHLSINFLVSLLKKHWQNVRSLHIKSSMGPPQSSLRAMISADNWLRLLLSVLLFTLGLVYESNGNSRVFETIGESAKTTINGYFEGAISPESSTSYRWLESTKSLTEIESPKFEGNTLSLEDFEENNNDDRVTWIPTFESTKGEPESTVDLSTNDLSSTKSEFELPFCDELQLRVNNELPGVINLTITGIDAEWISLSWDTPCVNTIDAQISYSISTCSINNCTEATTTNVHYNVTDLSPCTQYSFTVKLVINDRQSIGVNITATTSYDNLPEVKNLTIAAIGTEWIYLSWEPPCVNVTEAPFNYSIEACNTENCTQVTEIGTHYNVTDLSPCTPYIFIVKIVTKDGDSAGVNTTATTSYNISQIGSVETLKILKVNTNKIHLTWEAPSQYFMCICNYSILQCIEDDCNKTEVSSTEYVAENLEPCKLYSFTVKVVTRAVQSIGANISERTTSPKPSEPQFAEAVSGNFSLNIHWQPPEVGATCIKHYRVTINPNAVTETTANTSITINGLYACTKYTIYINAVNVHNNDGGMATIKGETIPVVTKPPALHIPMPWISSDSISLIWSIARDNNHCPLISIVTFCNYTMRIGHGYEPRNGLSFIQVEADVTLNATVVRNATVENLSPYTSYACYAYTINKAGNSNLSEAVNATTLQDVPSAPMLNVTDITESKFTLSWEEPKYLAGKLENIEITISWEPLFPIPDWCAHEKLEDVKHFNNSVFNYEHPEGRAYANYTVVIKAKTAVGWGNYSDPLIFQSKPGASEIVANFTYTIKESENDTNILDTILTWGFPCSANGIVEYFNITINGSKSGFTPHIFSVNQTIVDNINKNDMISINVNELKGEYNYTFTVTTKVAGVNDLGAPATINVLYPAGIPPQPDEEYIRAITIDPYKARRSTSTAAILLPLFPNTNGEIMYYSIIISEMGYNNAMRTRFDLKNNAWPNTSSWEEAMLNDFTIPYQATRPYWDPYPNYVADYGHMKAVKFMLGGDTACKEISSNTQKRLYCNGPLKPDTWYHVRMRAFTYAGYTDSIAFVVKTNAELNIAIVIGIVLSILFLGILTTMMLLVKKCSPQVVLRRFLHSDMPGSPVPAPFTRKKFIAHCQQLVDNPGKLSNEFRLLQTLSIDLQMPTNTACLQANRKKNRYSDILPYDFSRVKLEIIDNDPNTDYINASFIRGYAGEDEYIACQGPKEETTYDFWRMMDQYNINLIVMLTQLVEKGKEKCHQYFPTIGETFRYENMTIRCASELDFRTYTQRTLVLQKGNKKRNITHLHFKDWPDHDVPEDFDAMINFCQTMRRNILASKGFVVIHCSAGIGRTGTLIAIDILLQHLRDNRKLDVFGTVYRLRHHRINMVQRESQYAYIYNCIKQVLKNPYCLKTFKPPPVDPVYENITKKMKAESNPNTNLVNNQETSELENSKV